MPGASAIEVRVASSHDEQVIAYLDRLHRHFRSDKRGGESYLAFLDLRGFINNLGADGPPWVLLASADGSEVGIAALEIRLGSDVQHAHLRCLFGTERERSFEIESSLLDHAEQLARQHGCRAIDIEVLPGDRALKSLLEGSGYKARLLTMHRSFEPED